MRSEAESRRSAFTLIELLVVMVIMSLLAATASLSLGSVMDRYQLSRAAETIEAFDGRARRSARLSREAIDAFIRRGHRELVVTGSRRVTPDQTVRYRLPSRVDIDEVKLRNRIMTARDVAIGFTDRGRSPSYAVRIRRGKMTRWIVVLGISGQVILVSDEEEADALLML